MDPSDEQTRNLPTAVFSDSMFDFRVRTVQYCFHLLSMFLVGNSVSEMDGFAKNSFGWTWGPVLMDPGPPMDSVIL